MQKTTIILEDIQWEWVKQKAIGGKASLSAVIRDLIDTDMRDMDAGDLIKPKTITKAKPTKKIPHPKKRDLNMPFEI